jgi:RecA/RadA recombinase
MAKKKAAFDEDNPLTSLRDMIASKSKGSHVSILSDSDIAIIKDNLPTPALDLNRIISGSIYKGIPEKTLSLFVGPEASGKSSFICLCLAEAQRKGYTIVVIDTEGAWTDDFVKRWGLDPTKILYIYEPWVDNIMVQLGQIVESGATKIALALDSIGALDTMKLIEDAEKGEVKADQGQLQKKIKRMLKMINNIVKGQSSIAMVSGHYYGNPSQYGSAEQVGGGKYMQLAPNLIVSLKKTKMLDGTGKDAKIIGNAVKAITLKNRWYPPFNEALIEIDYQKGINKCAGLMDIALEMGIITVGGSWYSFEGEKAQGLAKAMDFLDNPKVLKKIDEWLAKTGYSTVNENVAEANKIIEQETQKDNIDNEEELDDNNDKEPKGKKLGGISLG